MKRIMLLIAALVFLAAGAAVILLYSFGEKAIENSITELSELESSPYESRAEEKTPEAGLDITKEEAAAEKPAVNDIKDNNAAIAAAPPINADSNISHAREKEDNPQKDKVSVSEKDIVIELLLSKLTKKDISELKGMLSNGITAEEKKRAKTILYSRLTTEDLNKIMEAYLRYTQQK